MNTYPTFKAWLLATLDTDQIRDLASHGADVGWPGLTYTKDCAELFDTYGGEIWDMAVQTAEDQGAKNVAELIATFRRSDMLDDLSTFKNLMVWFAAEEYARQLAGDDSDDSE